MGEGDKALGRSWVASQGVVGNYRIDLARFGVGKWGVPGVEAISMIYDALEPRIRRAALGDVSVGKIITNQAQSECGLFVDLGPTEGAAVTATCSKHVATEVTLVVARSSPWLRRVMWTVLVVCCVGGVLGMKALDLAWDPVPQLVVGLLGGCAVAVVILALVARAKLLTGGRSGEVADQLDQVVRSWVDSDPAKAPRKKRRKKRRAQKKTDEKTSEPSL